MRRATHNAALLFAIRGAPKKRKKLKPRKKAPKKPKKSDFVRFFESLEERGPLSPRHGKLYERWTKRIREQMEAEGIWPTGQQKPSTEVVAQYVSRLMRLFWNYSRNRKWYQWEEKAFYLSYRETAYAQLRTQFNVFYLIFNKIREKGRRSKSFYLSRPVWYTVSRAGIWERFESICHRIEPFTPFNDQALDI